MTSPLTADLSKKWLLRLNGGTDAVPAWTPLGSMTGYTPRIDATKQDGTTFDNGLYKGPQFTTQLGWGGSGTVLRLRNAAIEDPGQRLMRLAAVPETATGVPATIGVQILDRFGGPDENRQGRGTFTWEPQGGGNTDLQSVNFTLDGEGFAPFIANPLASAIVPAVAAASPSGAAQGQQVSVYGAGFTGTTGAGGVKFGATNAASYVVVSDSLIVAVVPAGAAGSAPITVTTPAGTSNALAYTRGA